MTAWREAPIPTDEALAVSEALRNLDLEHQPEKALEVADPDTGEMRQFFADIWIPGSRVDIEIDGDHHASDPGQLARDADRDYLLPLNGIQVKRFKNRDVHADPAQVAEEIVEFCNQIEEESEGLL